MASVVYNSHKLRAMEAAVNLETVTAMKIMLLDDLGTTPDNPDHDFVNDIAASEFADTGYTGGFNGAGRKSLANRAATVNLTDNRAELDFDDITWTTLGGTATVVFAVLIIEVTNDAGSHLVSAHDLADTLTNASDFQLIVGATGALHYT